MGTRLQDSREVLTFQKLILCKVFVGKPDALMKGAESYTKPAREKQGALLSLSISRQNFQPVSNGGFFVVSPSGGGNPLNKSLDWGRRFIAGTEMLYLWGESLINTEMEYQIPGQPDIAK